MLVYDAIARVRANATLMARIFVEFVTYLFHPSLYTRAHRRVIRSYRVGGGALLDLEHRSVLHENGRTMHKIVSLEIDVDASFKIRKYV